MRSFLGLAVALFVLVSGQRASAEVGPSRPRPIELGFSSGYSRGLEPISAIPLVLDLDYRFSPNWGAGVFGELGFPRVSIDDEEASYAAGGHHYRVGIEAQYHAKSESRVEPWLGVGFGYDVLRATYHETSSYWDKLNPTPDHASRPLRASGFELGHLRLGIDFRIFPAFAIGPFLSASVVAYRNQVGVTRSDVNLWGNIGLKATVRL